MHDSDSLIRERAYRIWEADGCPQGREAEHWMRAERELAAEVPSERAGPGADPTRRATKQPRSAKPRR